MISEQAKIDPDLTDALMQAVLAAYADHDNENLTVRGYKCIARFKGWATVLSNLYEERFGLVFRADANPNDYIIAFRGTLDLADMYDDLWVNQVKLIPYKPANPFPENIYVASGFHSIYVEKGTTTSMQEQVFKCLGDPLKINSVSICGHSLGGALASLFALDFKAAYPAINLQCTTFASPRVGSGNWAKAFDNTYGLKTKTHRVYNYYDYVPSLPPSGMPLYYEHVGQPFQICTFVKDAWIPYPLSRHSMKNYDVVVRHASRLTPQVWVDEYPDNANVGWTMQSTALQTVAMPEWAAMTRAMVRNPGLINAYFSKEQKKDT